MGLSYLNAGDEISAAQMNALVAELDDALTALLSGKSPLCFRPDYELQAGATTLLSIPFYFGDPSKRKILSGVSAQYDQAFFDTFVGTLQADGLNADTRRYIVRDTITPAQWESVRAMFGFQPGLATSARLASAWPLDFSLQPYQRFIAGFYLWYQFLADDGMAVRPWEHLHDRAVAEIIFEGMPAPVFTWPREWSKFGCLRFHNLDAKPIEVIFAGLGTTVRIPALGCKSVRLTGAEAGRRTGIDSTYRYFWKFDDEDQPVYDGPRNHHAGVLGTSGFNPLCSIPMLHAWVTAFGISSGSTASTGFFFDPRVKWNGSSLYASKFAPTTDDSILAKFSIHGGDVRSVLLVDGEFASVSETVQWEGASLVSDSLAFAKSGRTLTITSKAEGRHDVVPESTNILGESAHAMEGASVTRTASSPGYVDECVSESDFDITASYYDADWNVVTVSSVWPIAELDPRSFDSLDPFSKTIGKCKALTVSGAVDPDTSISTHGDRSVVFDGRGLWMTWSVSNYLNRPWQLNTEPNPAEIEMADDSFTTHHAALLAQAASGYDVLPARLTRHMQDAPGFRVGSGWTFTDHPEALSGDAADGEDWTLATPAPDETDIAIHGEAPSPADVRAHRLYPVGSNLPRALRAIQDPARWALDREDILAGTLQLEDAKRILRIPGSVEHYNLLAARLNSIACIRPYQFTDLIHYGQPFAESSAGVEITPRHAKRLDNSAAARALAVGYGMRISTAADIPTLVSLVGQDASEWLGEDRDWLYGVLPLTGWDAGNNLPPFEWVDMDEVSRIAKMFGLPHFVQRITVPFRVGVYRTTTEPTGWSYFSSAMRWETDSDADYVTLLPDVTVSEVATWRTPVAFADTDADAVAFIRAQYPTPADSAHPFTQRQAVRLDVQSEVPTYASGWAWENRSRLLLQPMPHFRYSGTSTVNFFAPIVAESAPPVAAKALAVTEAIPESGFYVLNPQSIKAAAWPESGDWLGRTMVYVTLVPQWGFFRSA